MREGKLYSVWDYGIRDFPKRAKRLILHLLVFVTFKSQIPNTKWYDWPVDLIFYITDLLFVPEIQMSIILLLKPNCRFLNSVERSLVNNLFSNRLVLNSVLINDEASYLVRKFAYAYVTHNIIHYEKSIINSVFIHEMMHVFQFQRFGSVYIYRALKAQKSKSGYDYGGLPRLERGMIKGKTIFHYNFEQQAMILEDYFLENQIANRNTSKSLEVYEYYYQSLFS